MEHARSPASPAAAPCVARGPHGPHSPHGQIRGTLVVRAGDAAEVVLLPAGTSMGHPGVSPLNNAVGVYAKWPYYVVLYTEGFRHSRTPRSSKLLQATVVVSVMGHGRASTSLPHTHSVACSCYRCNNVLLEFEHARVTLAR